MIMSRIDRRVRVGWALVCLSCLPGIAGAQVDAEALRQERLTAQVQFFNRDLPAAERVEALDQIGYPDEQTFTRLLATADDPTELPTVRLAALKLHRYDEVYLRQALSIISDPGSDEMLAAGLVEDIARRTTFRQPVETRQQIQTALREVLDDPRPGVRLRAYQALVPAHDPVAVGLLVEGLESPAGPPIPVPAAIELLHVDGPMNHIATVRPYLDNQDPAVVAQASRVLALDPDSRDRVAGLATSGEADPAVRLAALRALASADDEFIGYATDLMGDPEERPEIRFAAMEAAMGRLNYQAPPDQDLVAFAQSVRSLSEAQGVVTEDGVDVGGEARELLAHLIQVFPRLRPVLQ